MRLNGFVLGFDNDEGQSLAKLVTDCGYTKIKGDPSAKSEINVNGVLAGNVEVERRGDKVYATITVNDYLDAPVAIREVLRNFRAAGVL